MECALPIAVLVETAADDAPSSAVGSPPLWLTLMEVVAAGCLAQSSCCRACASSPVARPREHHADTCRHMPSHAVT